MMDYAKLDPTTSKADVLSRKTTIAEGMVEDMPTTAESQTHSTKSPCKPVNADDHQHHRRRRYIHPSQAGTHKPSGAAGYLHLAEFMTTTQYGMVRKYKDLSLLNLLYLQAEIYELRAEWDAEVAADARATGAAETRRLWDYHWFAMANGAKRGLEGRRWEIWQRLRERLYEYYDAISKHEQICALPNPSNDQRTTLFEYITSADQNGGRTVFLSNDLKGDDPDVYREKWLQDMVVFEHQPETHDAFARWVVMPLLKAAHVLCLGRGKKTVQQDLETGVPLEGIEKGPQEQDPEDIVPLYQYNATSYTNLNRTLNAIIIILVPCAAIVSLNAVPDTNKRVGMVCAFSLVCAVGMALGSSASRVEMLAVTAAFMSVQLVFVGQQQSSPAS